MEHILCEHAEKICINLNVMSIPSLPANGMSKFQRKNSSLKTREHKQNFQIVVERKFIKYGSKKF